MALTLLALTLAAVAPGPRDAALVDVSEDAVVARLPIAASELDRQCRVGPDGELEPLSHDWVRSRTGWSAGSRVYLYVGPRRVATGVVTDIAVGEGCAAEASIEPDEMLPWTSPADVVWATVRERPSSAPLPARRALVRAAERAAIVDAQATIFDARDREGCVAALRVAARGVKNGAVVGVSCELSHGAYSAAYFVASGREPVAVRPPAVRDDGPELLLDVVNPTADRHLDAVFEVPAQPGKARQWIRLKLPAPPKPRAARGLASNTDTV